MSEDRHIPIWLRIILPLLLAVGLGFYMQPWRQIELSQNLQRAREQGNLSAEADYLAQLAAWQPWQSNLWEAAGQKALQAGEVKAAIQFFRNAGERNALSPDGFHNLADAYDIQGDADSALEVREGLIERGQASPLVYEKVTRHYWRAGDFVRAGSTAQKWVRVDGKNAQAQFLYGLMALVNHPAQASQPLIQSKFLNLSHAAQVDALLQAYQRSQQESHAGYQKVILGRALASVGYWDLAERIFTQGTLLTPDYAEAWAFLGEAHQQLGQEGWTEISKAIRLDPKSVITQALAAIYYRRQGKPEESLSLLNAVARAEPKQAMWQVELGNTLLDLRDIPAAVEHYRQAALIEPKDVRYWIMLAEFCANHQASLRDVGLPAARQALTLAPDQSAALDVMGQVMVGLEDFTSAERFFLQALEKDRGFAAAYLHLGQLYLQTDRMPEAQDPFLLAKKYSPEKSSIRLVAQRLLQRYFGIEP